mmetsp:Transcript_2351/g.9401  ORF Transcript_2351/g.9401 Transcript_2351/m.9401 type:complete len:89 (-) Transcript_2351:404-670(-)
MGLRLTELSHDGSIARLSAPQVTASAYSACQLAMVHGYIVGARRNLRARRTRAEASASVEWSGHSPATSSRTQEAHPSRHLAPHLTHL